MLISHGPTNHPNKTEYHSYGHISAMFPGKGGDAVLQEVGEAFDDDHKVAAIHPERGSTHDGKSEMIFDSRLAT